MLDLDQIQQIAALCETFRAKIDACPKDQFSINLRSFLGHVETLRFYWRGILAADYALIIAADLRVLDLNPEPEIVCCKSQSWGIRDEIDNRC